MGGAQGLGWEREFSTSVGWGPTSLESDCSSNSKQKLDRKEAKANSFSPGKCPLPCHLCPLCHSSSPFLLSPAPDRWAFLPCDRPCDSRGGSALRAAEGGSAEGGAGPPGASVEVPATDPGPPPAGRQDHTGAVGGPGGPGAGRCLSVGPASTACRAKSHQGPW